MTKHFAVGLAAALLVAPIAKADDVFLCSLSSTSPTATSTNCSGTTRGAELEVQCKAGTAYVRAGTKSTDLAVATNIQAPQGALYPVENLATQEYVSILAVSGTVSCDIYARRKRNK